MNYGPGEQYKINTEKEFHVKTQFWADGKVKFQGHTTTLTQGDNEVDIGCLDHYNHALTD